MTEADRWLRQTDIPQFGQEKQQKLKKSKAVILGIGGVGCPAALYLAAAGIGEILLVDHDCVEIGNLNRQILFTTSDVGKSKALAAGERISSLDPGIKVTAMVQEITSENIHRLIRDADILLDCLDRNKNRLLVNDACVNYSIPAIHSFAQDFSGQLLAVLPGQTACLRCIMDESYPESFDTPVIGVATGMIGVAAAAQAIRILTGLTPIENVRLIYDLIFSEVIKIPAEKDTSCPVCSAL